MRRLKEMGVVRLVQSELGRVGPMVRGYGGQVGEED
jgi:hypothetical protein